MPNPFTHLRGVWLLTVPAIPLLTATLILQPIFEETGDLVNDWYRHAVYFSVFLYGWWLGADRGVWDELVRLRKHALGWAVGIFCVYALMVFSLPDDVPKWLEVVTRTMRNFYIWLALSAILGWGKQLLNRPFKWLPWANASVYPWYILHQSLIILMAYWLLPLNLGPVIEPALVLFGTIAGCWLLTALASRVTVLRPCFGIKPARRLHALDQKDPTTAFDRPQLMR